MSDGCSDRIFKSKAAGGLPSSAAGGYHARRVYHAAEAVYHTAGSRISSTEGGFVMEWEKMLEEYFAMLESFSGDGAV